MLYMACEGERNFKSNDLLDVIAVCQRRMRAALSLRLAQRLWSGMPSPTLMTSSRAYTSELQPSHLTDAVTSPHRCRDMGHESSEQTTFLETIQCPEPSAAAAAL